MGKKSVHGEDFRIRIADKLLAQVDAIAEKRFTTRSEIVRQAIRDYLDRLEGSVAYPEHTPRAVMMNETTEPEPAPKARRKVGPHSPHKH